MGTDAEDLAFEKKDRTRKLARRRKREGSYPKTRPDEAAPSKLPRLPGELGAQASRLHLSAFQAPPGAQASRLHLARVVSSFVVCPSRGLMGSC